MDETSVKIRGEWKYLYRAVDKQGNTIDFLLTAKRDMKAASAMTLQRHSSQGGVDLLKRPKGNEQVSF